jgi:hypothetical protein
MVRRRGSHLNDRPAQQLDALALGDEAGLAHAEVLAHGHTAERHAGVDMDGNRPQGHASTSAQ